MLPSLVVSQVGQHILVPSWKRCPHHSYYKELVRKPGKLQRNKQRSKDLCWKVHDPAQSFVLCSHTLAELRNGFISIA